MLCLQTCVKASVIICKQTLISHQYQSKCDCCFVNCLYEASITKFLNINLNSSEIFLLNIFSSYSNIIFYWFFCRPVSRDLSLTHIWHIPYLIHPWSILPIPDTSLTRIYNTIWTLIISIIKKDLCIWIITYVNRSKNSLGFSIKIMVRHIIHTYIHNTYMHHTYIHHTYIHTYIHTVHTYSLISML